MSRSTTGRPAAPIPWLSAGLLAVFVVFSVQARLASEAASRQIDGALEQARSYFVDHPYLEPGEALTARITADGVKAARREFEKQRSANGWTRTPPGVVRRQQDELAKRLAAARAQLGSLPARGVAVVPTQGFALSWWLHPALHGSPWQLIGNGLLLLLLGVYLERSLGRVGLALLASLAALAGAGAWVAATPAQASFGLASAAPLLAGLYTAFAIRFWPQRDEGFYLVAMVLGALWLALPPWLSATWFFAEVDPLVSDLPPAATSVYWGYLGAAGAGALAVALAWLLGLDGARKTAGGSAVTRDPRYKRAARAREAGRPREALELFAEQLAADPDAYEAALAMWELAVELGREVEAETALLRVIRIEHRRKLVAAAVDHWLVLTERHIPEAADLPLLVHMALLLREQGYRDPAVAALRFALERSHSHESHVIASRIARAARGLDPGVVEEAAWRALGSVELEIGERQSLEQLIGEAIESGGGRGVGSRARGSVEAAAGTASAPRPAPIAIETRQRGMESVLAVPLELLEDGLAIQTEGGAKKIVRYERIDGVAVAAVHGIAPKPVILVDLILNWKAPVHETLRLIRMRGDRFDPKTLFPGQTSAVEALRSFVTHVLERSGAVPLPDQQSALGRPFASFEELALYQRAVLLAESD